MDPRRHLLTGGSMRQQPDTSFFHVLGGHGPVLLAVPLHGPCILLFNSLICWSSFHGPCKRLWQGRAGSKDQSQPTEATVIGKEDEDSDDRAASPPGR